jgi:hypothetical protein
MLVLVEEDVAANEMWQKTEDGHADGMLQYFHVM